jgi:hypothetical protein
LGLTLPASGWVYKAVARIDQIARLDRGCPGKSIHSKNVEGLILLAEDLPGNQLDCWSGSGSHGSFSGAWACLLFLPIKKIDIGVKHA